MQVEVWLILLPALNFKEFTTSSKQDSYCFNVTYLLLASLVSHSESRPSGFRLDVYMLSSEPKRSLSKNRQGCSTLCGFCTGMLKDGPESSLTILNHSSNTEMDITQTKMWREMLRDGWDLKTSLMF